MDNIFEYGINLPKKYVNLFSDPESITGEKMREIKGYCKSEAEKLLRSGVGEHLTGNCDKQEMSEKIILKLLQSLSHFRCVLEGEKEDLLHSSEWLPLIYELEERNSNRWEVNILHQYITHAINETFVDTINEENIPLRIKLTIPSGSRNYEEELTQNASEMQINIRLLQLSIQSKGRIELYFNSYMAIQLLKSIVGEQGSSLDNFMKNPLGAFVHKYYTLAASINRVQESIKSVVFNKEKYERFMKIFIQRGGKYDHNLKELKHNLFYSQISQDRSSLYYIEKLLVGLLGHSDMRIRDESIKLLNLLYDGVDWQLLEAYVPVVTSASKRFIVSENIEFEGNIRELGEVFLTLNAPSFYKHSLLWVISWHKAKVSDLGEGKYIVAVHFHQFWRSGFYDWKFVRMDASGKLETLQRSGDVDVDIGDIDTNTDTPHIFAQGRFIVHPSDIKEEQMHEIQVDYREKEEDPTPNFYTVASLIKDYKSQGINSLYIMGALERDNGTEIESNGSPRLNSAHRPNACPLAVTCRATANRMLGGDKGFMEVVQEGKRLGVKIIVDCLARVSSSRMHRKYTRVLLQYLDEGGKRVLCYGTDGRGLNYQDSATLNYRKLNAWNLLIKDIVTFTNKFGINGIHLDNAQAWPQIFELDETEMYRVDTDGVPAYTTKEIFQGKIVILNEQHGFWDSELLETYSNPFFIKLCKELWSRYPEFLMLGECWGGPMFENRQGILARSGIIPRLFKMPQALGSLFGKRLNKEGQITHCAVQNVSAIVNWHKRNRRFMPKGSFMAQSGTSHSWPYPALLFGKGAWTAVDLLFFMPDLPITFMGEIEGKAYRRNTTNVYQARPLPKRRLERSKSQLKIAMELVDSEDEGGHGDTSHVPHGSHLQRVKSLVSLSAPQVTSHQKDKMEEVVIKSIGPSSGFDLTKISMHYAHRRKLRAEKMVLRHGEVVPLEAKHMHGTHSHVFAFARFSYTETAIIAINFTEHQVSFYIDMGNLIPYFKKNYNYNTVVTLTDWMKRESGQEYYFLWELMLEHFERILPPFQSTILGLVVCQDDPYVYAVAMERSFLRLMTKLEKHQDISNNQLILQLLETLEVNKPLDHFAMYLANLNLKYLRPHGIDGHELLRHIHKLKGIRELGAKFWYSLKKISESIIEEAEELNAYRISKSIIESNYLGPIVFMCPELGRWSTAGGLGVMVDELTQGLALLGEDITVISPYYHTNRKGVTGYLEGDPCGIKYISHSTVYLDKEYKVGVWKGEEHGVKVIFLHEPTIFPRVYAPGKGLQIMTQISLFGKAALQVLCDSKLIPSLVVTNDWFSGLVPGYAKCKHFGNVFDSTTFLHIVHNLDKTYEGRLYADPGDNFGNIHQLPTHILVDPYWGVTIYNPSRCAILMSDQWATVSKSYKDELLAISPLASLLAQKKNAFAFPNGIPIKLRQERLLKFGGADHISAKRALQQKYFNYEDVNREIPVFAFVGRVTKQKGVELILDIAEEFIKETGGKVNILVGGPADPKEPYANKCANKMKYLSSTYPNSFWASPEEFFTDGPLINLGADFGLMPSEFEPGGIVQHEFFVAGTPVVAFKTGGLKDSVHEYMWDTGEGNGYTFETHRAGDLKFAMKRALGTFRDVGRYGKLRGNAARSTMDGAVVCRAWDQEFHRLRGKVFIDKELVDKLLEEKVLESWNHEEFNETRMDAFLMENCQGFLGNLEEFQEELKRQEVSVDKDNKVIVRESRIPVLFKFTTGEYRAHSIKISGSFDNWKQKFSMSYDPVTNYWFLNKHIRKGKYLYKYLVDDRRWECNMAEPTIKDKSGNLNNLRYVPERLEYEISHLEQYRQFDILIYISVKE